MATSAPAAGVVALHQLASRASGRRAWQPVQNSVDARFADIVEQAAHVVVLGLHLELARRSACRDRGHDAALERALHLQLVALEATRGSRVDDLKQEYRECWPSPSRTMADCVDDVSNPRQ